MTLSGSSSPYVIERAAEEVDLYTVLPGLLPTVPEESYDADRRSYLSYESWDTSFSTIQEEKYAEEFTSVLPGLPKAPARQHSVVPTNIGDIAIPPNLLRTVSSTKGWRPDLDLPDENGYTASDIISPQLQAPGPSPIPARNRVQSVTLGTLQPAHIRGGSTALSPEQYTSLIRKTSAPIGQEVNRVIPIESQDTLSALRPTTSTYQSQRYLTRTATSSSLSPTATRKPAPRRTDTSSSLSPTTTRKPAPRRTATDSSLSPTTSRKSPRHSLGIQPSGQATSARDFAAGGRPKVLHSDSSQRGAFSRWNFGRRQSGRADLPTPDVELGPDDLMPADMQRDRRSTIDMLPDFIQVVARPVADAAAAVFRRPTLVEAYERAKIRTVQLQRKPWVQKLFEYSVYLLLVCFVYFVLIGVPLWNGAVWWLW